MVIKLTNKTIQQQSYASITPNAKNTASLIDSLSFSSRTNLFDANNVIKKLKYR